MQQSSDSIAQLASALAKAQLELVNPQKTLTGTIDRWGNGGRGRAIATHLCLLGSKSCGRRSASTSLPSSRPPMSIRKPRYSC
jgi:hypothetical protein